MAKRYTRGSQKAVSITARGGSNPLFDTKFLLLPFLFSPKKLNSVAFEEELDVAQGAVSVLGVFKKICKNFRFYFTEFIFDFYKNTYIIY